MCQRSEMAGLRTQHRDAGTQTAESEPQERLHSDVCERSIAYEQLKTACKLIGRIGSSADEGRMLIQSCCKRLQQAGDEMHERCEELRR